MESLYARDTPTAQEHKLRLTERDQVMASHEDGQVALKAHENSSSETLNSLLETSAVSSATSDAANAANVATSTASTVNSTDDAFGFNYTSLPRVELEASPQQLDERWRRDLAPQTADLGTQDGKTQQETPEEKKTKDGRLAASKLKTDTCQLNQQEISQAAPITASVEPTQQPRRAGVASMTRRAKPAITINTGSGSAGVGTKRPPPTPVSPPIFSWNDILRVQNLIERCLQQYLSKNDILITLKEQANVDPAFANVVWQKLEEQNPTFFRAYSLQLQLKEQIIAFNYLVGQQKEMAAKGGKRLLHYSNATRSSVNRASDPITTSPATTLPPISMDARTFLRTPIRSAKRTPAGKRAYNMNMYQLSSPSVGLGGTSSGMTTLPPPSPLPLPSPIKTDLDTHAFFT